MENGIKVTGAWREPLWQVKVSRKRLDCWEAILLVSASTTWINVVFCAYRYHGIPLVSKSLFSLIPFLFLHLILATCVPLLS